MGHAGDKRQRKEEEQAKEDEKKERKRQAIEKKEAEEKEKAEVRAAFARCKPTCMCDVVPCPWEKWVLCPQCGPKKGLCRVQACKALREPLMLGYNGA